MFKKCVICNRKADYTKELCVREACELLWAATGKPNSHAKLLKTLRNMNLETVKWLPT